MSETDGSCWEGGTANHERRHSDTIQDMARRAENPDELDQDPAWILAQTDFEHQPYRHPDKLQEAWQEEDSIAGVTRRLGCSRKAAKRWLHIYGYYEKEERLTTAERLERMDADEVTGGAD